MEDVLKEYSEFLMETNLVVQDGLFAVQPKLPVSFLETFKKELAEDGLSGIKYDPNVLSKIITTEHRNATYLATGDVQNKNKFRMEKAIATNNDNELFTKIIVENYAELMNQVSDFGDAKVTNGFSSLSSRAFEEVRRYLNKENMDNVLYDKKYEIVKQIIRSSLKKAIDSDLKVSKINIKDGIAVRFNHFTDDLQAITQKEQSPLASAFKDGPSSQEEPVDVNELAKAFK